MTRSRLTAWGGATLLALVAAAAACTAKQQNGESCLKNFDCESERCIQYICVDPNASRGVIGDTGTAPADTGVADSGPADSGAAETTSDAPAETTAETTPAETSSD